MDGEYSEQSVDVFAQFALSTLFVSMTSSSTGEMLTTSVIYFRASAANFN